ncbi:MAG: hypothetical protein KAU95_01865 [Candidatus Aenigmarchaeota archaeon]|nr:hypothetical protein [Candidatus Aenigmarchaeota archaeon]
MAGENRDATGDVEANHQFLSNYAEAYLSNLVKHDIVTDWTNLNATYKILFSEWAARFGGNGLIKFNMAGYTTRIEAEDMVNLNIWRMEAIKEILDNSSVQDFLNVSE